MERLEYARERKDQRRLAGFEYYYIALALGAVPLVLGTGLNALYAITWDAAFDISAGFILWPALVVLGLVSTSQHRYLHGRAGVQSHAQTRRQTLVALLLLLANVPAVIVSAILYTNTNDIFEVVVVNDSAEAITRLDVGLDRRPKQPFGSVAPGTTERFRPATAIGEGSVEGRAVFPSGETTFEITSYVELGSNGPEQHVVRFVTPATQPTVKRKR